ncbi:hypothetical protein KGD82_11145 [Nocardiopsis eucommiae]|uniref:Uncharacterized protein n=1 Tax=Nocardiopsis eucommiae TaxID=2831970 RepID=A0A975QLQ3_9ACTN|nr:hypothetical protein KGD82_11145 [Nocardiopsis eucommiae]
MIALLALGSVIFLVAGLILLWPLLVWITDLPRFGLVACTAVGLTLTIFAFLRLRAVHRPETAMDDGQRQPLPLPVLITLVILAVSAAIGLIITGAWWAMGAQIPTAPPEFTAGHLNAISIRAFAIVTGLGATALLVINYRRQVTTEAENKRAEAAVERENLKLFDERFTNAYTELGSEHPAVRLGAVHALANLADDAPEYREDLVQTVVNVLCAYIRMPYTPEPEEPPKDASEGFWRSITYSASGSTPCAMSGTPSFVSSGTIYGRRPDGAARTTTSPEPSSTVETSPMPTSPGAPWTSPSPFSTAAEFNSPALNSRAGT